ncbi:MAG: hypothetical protein IJF71_01120 [Clostridia bacterium]|nr:hypothetical protein [Clostridia bacterium]
MYITVADFFEAAAKNRLTDAQIQELGAKKQAGDRAARDALVEGCLFVAAARLRRVQKELHTLRAVYLLRSETEAAVDAYRFTEEQGRFVHRLSLRLGKVLTRLIAES